MLDIATDRSIEARIFIINLRGRIDTLTAREFDDFFEDLVKRGERFFLLRAHELDYVSSAGIASIVKFVRRLKSLGGGAVVVGLNDEVALLFEFFGLMQAFPAFEDMKNAQRYLEEKIQRVRMSLELKQERIIRTRVAPRDPASPPQDTRQAASIPRPEPEVRARPIVARPPEKPLSLEVEAKATVPAGPSLGPKEPAAPTGSPASAPEQAPEQEGARDTAHEAIEFDGLRVLACEQCGIGLRLYRSGLHMCPGCGIEFDVGRDGSISYFEKL